MVVIIILFGVQMIGRPLGGRAALFMRGVAGSIPRRLLYLNCNKLSPLTREQRKICNRTTTDRTIRGPPPLCKQRKWLCNGNRVRPTMTPAQYFKPGPTGRLSTSRLERPVQRASGRSLLRLFVVSGEAFLVLAL